MKLYISFQKKSKKIVNHLKISEKKKKKKKQMYQPGMYINNHVYSVQHHS